MDLAELDLLGRQIAFHGQSHLLRKKHFILKRVVGASASLIPSPFPRLSVKNRNCTSTVSGWAVLRLVNGRRNA